MEGIYRAAAFTRLQSALYQRNLFELAHEFGVPTHIGGKLNKGWVGQTLERAAGISPNALADSDGLDFELKGTTLLTHSGIFEPKETIKITQLNPQKILEETFENSIFWKKLSRLILVGYAFESADRCVAQKILKIDITEPSEVQPLRAFWEDVQHLVLNGEISQHTSLGSSAGWLQLRGLGTGKIWSTCPITGDRFPARAFYATKRLIRHWLSQ